MVKTIARWLLAIGMAVAGINHFVKPITYVAMMPEVLPAPLALVYVSGVVEILCGMGLLVLSSRRAAGWALIALLIAVFPANVNMAVNKLPLGGNPVPTALLWARLPLQLVLIAWTWWVSLAGGSRHVRTR